MFENRSFDFFSKNNLIFIFIIAVSLNIGVNFFFHNTMLRYLSGFVIYPFFIWFLDHPIKYNRKKSFWLIPIFFVIIVTLFNSYTAWNVWSSFFDYRSFWTILFSLIGTDNATFIGVLLILISTLGIIIDLCVIYLSIRLWRFVIPHIEIALNSVQKKEKITNKSKSIIIIFLVLVPLFYIEVSQPIIEVREGTNDILLAYEKLKTFIGQGSLDIDNLLSGSTEIIELSTALRDAGVHLESAHSHYKLLNHPFYSLLLSILGYEDEISTILSLIESFSILVKTDLPIFIPQISELLLFLFGLTEEIQFRGEFWKVPDDYNESSAFFERLQGLDSFLFPTNLSSIQIKLRIKAINDLFSKSKFNSQDQIKIITNFLNDLSIRIPQMLQLSQSSISLLNATFNAMVVTDALAHDKFLLAKDRSDLTTIQINIANDQLRSMITNDLWEPIQIMVETMQDINFINNKLNIMTNSTKNMFLTINETIGLLNNLSNPDLPINGSLAYNVINNKTFLRLNSTSVIINESINYLQSALERSTSVIRFPFKEILSLFNDFFNGYAGAIPVYRDLYQSAINTFTIYNKIGMLIQNINNSFTAYNLNSTDSLNILYRDSILTQLTDMDLFLVDMNVTLVNAETFGAIRTNKTNWLSIVNGNNSFTTIINYLFDQFILIPFDLTQLDYANLFTTLSAINTDLSNLAINDIYIGLAPEN